MAQQQVTNCHGVDGKCQKATSFHIPLDESYSVTVSTRCNEQYVGVYKVDSSGRRRGVSFPPEIWNKLKTDSDVIDLALVLCDGSSKEPDYACGITQE